MARRISVLFLGQKCLDDGGEKLRIELIGVILPLIVLLVASDVDAPIAFVVLNRLNIAQLVRPIAAMTEQMDFLVGQVERADARMVSSAAESAPLLFCLRVTPLRVR